MTELPLHATRPLRRAKPPCAPPMQRAARVPIGARSRWRTGAAMLIACSVGLMAAAETPSAETAKPADEAAGPTLDITYVEAADITIDGHVVEQAWELATASEAMRVIDPDTLAQPGYRTSYRFLYTPLGLYVAAVMEQPPATLVSRLSSRDQYLNRDSFGLTLDTSGVGLYGYWFTVALGGSVMDGKALPERTLTEQWDGPWEGASARGEDGWSVEMFLPWSMMAMPAASDQGQNRGPRELTFWVDRKVAHLDEVYGWPPLPESGGRFMSALQPMRLAHLNTRRQLDFFPYASTLHDAIAADQEHRVGVDIAWRPTPNLQLTGTLNPDFGAVESDDVVVNLTAFETYFPEKRLFFLEGNEVFVTNPRSDVNRYTSRRGSGARPTAPNFTPTPTTLLNTRRIGGPPRHLTVPDGVEVADVERGKPTDLLGAVKAAGALGPLRFGALAAFEDEVELPGHITATGEKTLVQEAGRSFGVVRGLFESGGAGRRAIGYMGTLVDLPDGSASTHGIDAHMLSKDGRLRWDTQFMMSDTEETGYGVFTDMRFSQRRGLVHSFSMDYLDERLDVSDLGFIRQNDAVNLQYGLNRTKTNTKHFRQVRNSIFFYGQTNTDGFANRVGIFTNNTLFLANRSEVHLEVDYFPGVWDDRNSRGNGWFRKDAALSARLSYGTDSAKRFAWSAAIGADQEELDGVWSPRLDFGVTYTPNDRLSFEFDLLYKQRNAWLLHTGERDFATFRARDAQPRVSVDFFLTARQQLRFFMQWAGIEAKAKDYYRTPPSHGELLSRVLAPGAANEDFSLSRLTAQLRYRWEIGPLSDLFVVYTRGSRFLYEDEAMDGFGRLFSEAVDEPIIDFLVVKLRYRFSA